MGTSSPKSVAAVSLFHLHARLYQHTSAAITTNQSFSARLAAFRYAKMPTTWRTGSHPPSPHRGDGQQVLSVQAQRDGRQDAHQGREKRAQRRHLPPSSPTRRFEGARAGRKPATPTPFASLLLPAIRAKETRKNNPSWVGIESAGSICNRRRHGATPGGDYLATRRGRAEHRPIGSATITNLDALNQQF